MRLCLLCKTGEDICIVEKKWLFDSEELLLVLKKSIKESILVVLTLEELIYLDSCNTKETNEFLINKYYKEMEQKERAA